VHQIKCLAWHHHTRSLTTRVITRHTDNVFTHLFTHQVFWHSSAHVLGECMEKKYGAHLTIGPPVQDGFYYDAYMGDQ
jgi:threonyl-tRNA synthetase